MISQNQEMLYIPDGESKPVKVKSKHSKAYFLERALQGSQLRMAGKLINFLFPDGSELTILVEEKYIIEEAKDI